MKKLCLHIVGILAVILLLGIAGRCDYNETVIYNMPDEAYRALKEKLNNPSDSELVDEYMKDPDYWDSLAFDCVYK